MNRRNIITGILAAFCGVARAQQWNRPVIKDGLCVEDAKGNCTYLPALNNECPVCGTMAELYHPRKTNCCGHGGRPENERDGFLVCYPEDPPCEPDSRLIRCKRCNVAFYQDAEEPEK